MKLLISLAAACAVTFAFTACGNADLAPAGAAPAAPLVEVQSGLQSAVPAPALTARAWVAIDVTSDQILAEEHGDDQIEPASLTKIMTSYLVFKALDEKRISLSQMVKVSDAAWRTGGSRMFIEPRTPVSVEDLIRGMIIDSGNDATVALAETVAGSTASFVELMNKQAAELGMQHTHFMNVDGLPDPKHVTTVKDLAILAKRLIQDHPDDYAYYKEREFTYNKIKQPNRNRLLWADPSVDGMKTGHTAAAGFCLIASANRDGRRVLTVLVGAPSDSMRAKESLALLNWSYQNFEDVKLSLDARQVAQEAPVWKGSAATVKLAAPSAVWVSVPRGQSSLVKTAVAVTDPLIAPLSVGQQVGAIKVLVGDKVVREVPLRAQDAVGAAGFFGRAVDAVRLWFH